MSDEIGEIESTGNKQSRRLLMLAVFVMVIIFAHLTFHVVYFIYVEDYQSTNNWMVFGLSRVLTLALLIILPVIAIRIMPRLAIFDVVWFRWTRWEFLLFWLLPLVIYASRFILVFLANKYELPIESNIFPTLSNAFPISGLYVWMTISDALLFPIAEEAGYACYGCTIQTVCMILAYEDIAPPMLSRLQKEFELLATNNKIRFDFTEEKLISLDVIQCIFTDDGHGGGHIPRSTFKKQILPGGEFESAISIFASLTESDIPVWRKLERHRTTAEVKRYYDLSEKACLVSPWEYNIDGNYIKITIENIENRNPLIKTFSPAIDWLVEIAARFRAEQDALIATLGILRYKADSQKLPRDLSELFATGYLKTVPDDPFSDGSITYRLTNKDFILYSFGADFDDDGGMPSRWGEGEKGGDQVFWPVQEFDDYSESIAETKTQ